MTNLGDRLKRLSFPDTEFDTDVRHTYFALRCGLGGIGALLPIVLVGWGRICGIPSGRMSALSAFYWLQVGAHAPLRDWFVSSLATVGICLIVYGGYGRLENWLLNVAGAAIIVVALNPMAWPPLYAPGLPVHETAAFVFFGLIAATVWFCAGNTLLEDLQQVRARWLRIYRVFAIAMAAAPLAAFLLARKDQRIIWIEALGVWVFSAYWIVKTYELSRVSRVEPPSGPAPRLRWVGGTLKIVGPQAGPMPTDRVPGSAGTDPRC